MLDEPIDRDLPGRYELPASHAECRPGPTAPRPAATSAAWESMGRRCDEAILVCRDLWAIVRWPRLDPLYRRVLPDLRLLDAVLRRELRDRPDDPETAAVLAEVRRYLPLLRDRS